MLKLDPSLTTQENFLKGQVLLVDKPLEWTSFDLVKKIRNQIKIKKIGHAGTLDPLATGLMILCTGKKTKSIEAFMGQEKEYTGCISLGQTTPTFDLESEPSPMQDVSGITQGGLEMARQKLTGQIEQLPPIHSAIKVNGKRMYELARKGEKVEPKPRSVEVKVFELTKIELPLIHFRVVCSKGTYIRSLANDFGEILGVGGYLSALRRTRIGDFSVNDAQNINELIEEINTLS